MDEVKTIRLRTLGWVIIPIIVFLVIPHGLRRLVEEVFPQPWGGWQWFGCWLIVNGVGLAGWCVRLFNVEGRGTPLPFDPPKRFVATGPYRYVRNPMMLGMGLILWGETLLFESRTLALYTIALMVAAHLVVRFWEEPQLIRRFGQAYLGYQRAVPRWIPRRPRVRSR